MKILMFMMLMFVMGNGMTVRGYVLNGKLNEDFSRNGFEVFQEDGLITKITTESNANVLSDKLSYLTETYGLFTEHKDMYEDGECWHLMLEDCVIEVHRYYNKVIISYIYIK